MTPAAHCHGVNRSAKTLRPANAAIGISTMPTARTGPADDKPEAVESYSLPFLAGDVLAMPGFGGCCE